MEHEQAKEPIKIYLDDQEEPFKKEHPPLRFNFNTIQLPDGPHVLKIEASNGLAPPTIKNIAFTVRNGVAVSVSGIQQGQTIGGQVEMIVNAYAGNTEVDFEPRKAETPTPVPTWAWVLLLGVLAWTMFYLLNPADASQLQRAETEYTETALGERLYVDTCARCHGETGGGRASADGTWMPVPPLRDTRTYSLAQSPLNLLIKVVQGVDGTMMPGWGPILDNDEILAVVNHIRTSWRHDASTIDLDHRRPPAEIESLERALSKALMSKDAEALSQCCWPEGGRKPLLYRTDGVRARGRENVKEAWERYFIALGAGGRVTRFELTEERYDYESSTVEQNGAIVIGMGRIFLEAETQAGARVQRDGRFIRVYQLWQGSWALVFDFADIPMNVGCEIGEENCPPAETAPPAVDRPVGTVPSGDAIGYEDLQQIFRALGKDPGDAPHEDFWNWDYEKFCTGSFEESWEDPRLLENAVRLVVPGDPERSNLIRALEGEPILVVLPDGTEVEHAVARMPKNGPFLPSDVVARIRAWVQAGCPKVAGGAPHSSVSGGNAGGAPPPTPPIADAGTGTGTGTGLVGYADVVAIIKSTGKGGGDAPHENFWEQPWDAFVRFEFEESWEDADQLENKIRLVVPGDPDKSNLLRALEGKPLVVRLPDGSEEEHEKPKMPKSGPFLKPEDIATIRAWIVAGCPEVAGGPPHPTMEGAGGMPPAEPVISSVGFDDVRGFLKGLGKTPSSIPHGSFWENLSYAEFVAFKFPREWGDPYEYRLLIPYDAANSNLVKVLTDGKGIVRTNAAGDKIVEDVPRMPMNVAPIPQERLDRIIEWIDAGCPEEAGKPSALPRPTGADTSALDLDPKGPAPDPGGAFPPPDK